MKNLSPMLKSGIRPVLPEFGKIKIGCKSQTVKETSDGRKWQPPEKHDYFTITTMERGADNNFIKDENIHAILGDDKPTRIPIRLLYNELSMNFQSRFVCYSGKKVACMGDGEIAYTADGTEITCPCEKSEPGGTCKMNGVLSCIIEGTEKLGGVYKFRTTSFNAVQGLTSALAFISFQTKGILAGIPLELVISKKEGSNPKTGEPVKVTFVTLEFKGNIQALMNEAVEIRQIENTYDSKIKMLSGEVLEAEFTREIQDPEEFYPEPADNIDLGDGNITNVETGEIVEKALEPTPEPKKRNKKSVTEPVEKIITSEQADFMATEPESETEMELF